MKSLYLRIWLTVVAALALFALVSGWMWQRHLDGERARVAREASERVAAWAELVQRSLPPAEAPQALQAEALLEWAARLRVPMALDDAHGQRLAASDFFRRRDSGQGLPAGVSVRLDDGRTLWLARRAWRRGPDEAGPAPAGAVAWPGPAAAQLSVPAEAGQAVLPDSGPPMRGGPGRDGGPPPAPLAPWLLGLPGPVGPLVLVALLFVAVAAGAYPVVRRLTRRLESLKQGVAAFGAGDLALRVDESGHDEVAAVAATFNRSAERIETLVESHKRLLANASHELRSPLARLKMAVTMLADVPATPGGADGPDGSAATSRRREALVREIHTDIAELDTLVEEVLMSSRLDAGAKLDRHERVDLLGVAAEEAARTGAELALTGPAAQAVLPGSERLLRRAVRNLLENARRYGGDQVEVDVLVPGAGSSAVPGAGQPAPPGRLVLRISDRGPGVPAEFRERIFEPYFRLPGHAEREGGVGLGLALVKQIAVTHGGSVHCAPRAGGGSVFELSLPVAPA